MTTQPTPTPDTPPMPELPEDRRIGQDGTYLQKTILTISQNPVKWVNYIRTDSWEFAALMAFLCRKRAEYESEQYRLIIGKTDLSQVYKWHDAARAWQRIAESRMGGE